jgi:site-specific DNA-cytosine methylase
MRVLIACEYSGRVRDAFLRRGHNAMSCDLLETEVPGPHYQGPVEDVLHDGWDLMVAHPPCTHLAISGSRHFPEKIADGRQAAALDFVRLLMDAPIDRWVIENPISVISSAIRPPDQIIQPWEYGHGEVKATCLWLHNLPKLKPTNCVEGREPKIHMMPPGPDRWKERSRTFEGVAEAMGEQWGSSLPCVMKQCSLTLTTV